MAKTVILVENAVLENAVDMAVAVIHDAVVRTCFIESLLSARTTCSPANSNGEDSSDVSAETADECAS